MAAGSPRRQVVGITSSARYRPQFTTLAAGRVRAALEKTGRDRAAYADALSGLTGREITEAKLREYEKSGILPADVLMAIEAEADGLLPAAVLAGSTEDVSVYPGRAQVARHQWNDIIRGSRDQLWLYGMAEFGYATDDETPSILAEAADAGCEVRILLLDPSYEGAGEIDADEGSPEGTLATRIRASLVRFERMRAHVGPRLQIRTYRTHPTVSIVRGDSRMLATPYLQFTMGGNSPTLDLTAEDQPKTFRCYARHLDHLWEQAKDRTTS